MKLLKVPLCGSCVSVLYLDRTAAVIYLCDLVGGVAPPAGDCLLLPGGGEALSGYVVELEAVLETHAHRQSGGPSPASLGTKLSQNKKNGTLHFFPTLLCALDLTRRLCRGLPVREIQLQELPQERADAAGVRVQVRAGPVHRREVEGDGGVHGGVPAALPAAAGQRGLLQPQLQLHEAGRRAQVRGVRGAAGVRERDEEGAVPEALQAGAARLQADHAEPGHHRRVREEGAVQIPAVRVLQGKRECAGSPEGQGPKT